MNISGSIGVTVLNSNFKKIIIFADSHYVDQYCRNDSVKITNWIKEKLSKKYQILLEEVERGNEELIELWPNSPHIQELKNLYLKEGNVINGIDIRKNFYKFSWELLADNKKIGEITLEEYLKKLEDFFTFQNDFYLKKINFNNVLFNLDLIKKQLINLKNNYEKYKINVNRFMKRSLNYIYQNNFKWVFHSFDKLCSNIMEWYCIYLIFTNKNNSILHLGLFHTREIVEKLINNHYFYKTFDNGITRYPENKNISCVYLPVNVLKDF